MDETLWSKKKRIVSMTPGPIATKIPLGDSSQK
jgi:hypothetical protein